MAKTITQSVGHAYLWDGCNRCGSHVARLDHQIDEPNVQRLAALCDKMHHVVSTLSFVKPSAMSPRSHIVNNKMREKAGASGATGIVLDSMSEPTTGAKIAGASQRSAGRVRAAAPGLLGAVKYGGPLYESCSVSGLPRLSPEWPPRCYPLPRKPTKRVSAGGQPCATRNDSSCNGLWRRFRNARGPSL